MVSTACDAFGVMTVTLNRPEIRNAFDPALIAELTKIFKGLNSRKDIRCVVLRGEGKVFCAGADLNWMKDMVNYSLAKNKKDSLQLFAMFEAILNCIHPVICYVQGAAFGGALGLIAASDYVVADPETQFCFSEVKLGLAPAVISGFVLKKISLGHASPWMMSGQVFSSQQALQMGLVHAIEAHAENAVAAFLEAKPQAVRETKKLIHKVAEIDLKKAKILTTTLIAKLRVGAEGQAGLKAFLEKKK